MTKPQMSREVFERFEREIPSQGISEEMRSQLLNYDLNSQRNDGCTLLYLLCDYSPDVIRWFLENGADPNIRSFGGNSVLGRLCTMPLNLEKLELALKYGADPNCYDRIHEGTPLEIVKQAYAHPNFLAEAKMAKLSTGQIKEWEKKTIDLLLSYGATPTPIENLAATRGQRDLDQWPSSWSLVLARTTPATLASALGQPTESISPFETQKLALHAPASVDCLLLQVSGHLWTFALYLNDQIEQGLTRASELSKLGNTQTLWLFHEDVSDVYGYNLFEAGQAIEELVSAGEDDLPRFRSKRRKKRLTPDTDLWKIIDKTLRELDAFAMPLSLVQREGHLELDGPNIANFPALAVLVLRK